MKTFLNRLAGMILLVFTIYFIAKGSPIKVSNKDDDLCLQEAPCTFFRYTNKHDEYLQYGDDESILEGPNFDTLNVATFEIPACRCDEVRQAIHQNRFILKADLDR